MSQSHFMLALPMKSGRAGVALRQALAPLMPALFAAAGALGTVHYCCFAMVSTKTLLFLGHCDGDVDGLLTGLAAHAGPAFNSIFGSVVNAQKHLLQPLFAYKSLANGRTGAVSPFFVVLPAKSPLAFLQMQLLLRSMNGRIAKEFDAVGTTQFAQIVPLDDSQLGFFTLHSGTDDAYVTDLTKSSTFDVIFKFTKDPPPSPTWKYPEEFGDFVLEASSEVIGCY